MIHYFVCDNGTRVHVEDQNRGYFAGHTYFLDKEKTAQNCIKLMTNEVERLQNLIDAVKKNGIDEIAF